MRWPAKIPAGKTCEEVTATMDLLPSLATLCGGELPERKIDGVDISKVMLDPVDGLEREAIAWLHGGPAAATTISRRRP